MIGSLMMQRDLAIQEVRRNVNRDLEIMENSMDTIREISKKIPDNNIKKDLRVATIGISLVKENFIQLFTGIGVL